MGLAQAKNIARNALRYDMNCIVYNVLRAHYLIAQRIKYKGIGMSAKQPIDEKSKKIALINSLSTKRAFERQKSEWNDHLFFKKQNKLFDNQNNTIYK